MSVAGITDVLPEIPPDPRGSKHMRVRKFAATGVVIAVLIGPVSSMGITPVTPESSHEFSADLALTTSSKSL